jgi:hypothetical protein
MYGIEPEVTANYRRHEIQTWAANHRRPYRRPLTTDYEVPPIGQRLRVRLGNALTALGAKIAGSGMRQLDQPS